MRITLVFCIALLSGCYFVGGNTINKPTLTKPVKPYLPSWQVLDNGGMSINKTDTERLMRYILELEHYVEKEN